MRVVKVASYIVIATFLLTAFCVASLLGPLVPLDSRSIFVFALGAAGLTFGTLAYFELRTINTHLQHAQA